MKLQRAAWPATGLLWMGCVLLVGQTQAAGQYALPLAEATEWTVTVFGARFADGLRGKPLAFTVEAAWETPEGEGSTDLTGEVAHLEKAELSLSVPSGCTALRATLNWSTPAADLDIGLWCEATKTRLAPIFTVLKPERVRLDAQTAPLYEWLTKKHPGWWKGYPFWAEVEPAPRAPDGGSG